MKIIDIADKFPAKLKSNCANHIDHILSQLGSTQLVGIHLAEYEVDNHVPLTPILDMLSEIDGVSMSLHMCDDTLSNVDWKGLYGMAVDSDGDTYVISESHDLGLCNVAKYTDPDHAYYIEECDIESLSSEFNISAIIILRKKQSQSSLGQPLLPPPSKDADLDGSATKEHYVIRHFRRQSRTALSIIGISVVIALLGVITPLGFQTFTDKILPYQAQSSLMVIAILLVVAAMMTALFNYHPLLII